MSANKEPEVKRAGKFEYLTHIASVSAPAIVFTSAVLYISGFTRRWVIFESLGIYGLFEEGSIQSTMAEGFPAAIVGSIVVGVLLLILWGGTVFKSGLAKSVNPSERVMKIRSFIMKFDRLNTIGMAIVSLAIYGAGSGLFGGRQVLSEIKSQVESGCQKSCHMIRTDSKSYIGYMVAQDSKKVAIYTNYGIYIIPADDIRRISPIIDGKIILQPKIIPF